MLARVKACVRACVRACVCDSSVLVCSYFTPSLNLFVYSLATFNTVSVSFCVSACAFDCFCMYVCIVCVFLFDFFFV